MDVLADRCAGLDVHKGTVVAMLRRPSASGAGREEVRQYRTFTAALRELRGWLSPSGWRGRHGPGGMSDPREGDVTYCSARSAGSP